MYESSTEEDMDSASDFGEQEYIHISFESQDNLEVWKHVKVWVDESLGNLVWQCNYCRKIYNELFSTDMIYRHLLSVEYTEDNLPFNCPDVRKS